MFDNDSKPMKRVYLMRHAKSSHEESGLTDKERPLNDRGRSDAQRMAARLESSAVETVQHWYVSGAQRTKETFYAFKSKYHIPEQNYTYSDALYLIGEEDLESYIESLDDHQDTVAVICHNPGATLFVNRFSTEPIFNVPTMGVAVIEANCELWTDFFLSNPKVVNYLYPGEEK